MTDLLPGPNRAHEPQNVALLVAKPGSRHHPATDMPPPHLPAPPVWTWLELPARTPAQPRVLHWLSGLLPDDGGPPRIIRGEHGRPRLQPPHDRWDCNWSHSGEGLFVAAGHKLRLGVDVERARPLPRAGEIARQFFAREEAEWLAALPPAARRHAFVRLWCAKEAVLKAHGRGIRFGLDRVRFSMSRDGLQMSACDPGLGRPQDWQLQEFTPGRDYHAALAWRLPWPWPPS